MTPETMTTEAVLNKVRKQFGELDTKAEQAVVYTLAVLQEARANESPAPSHEDGFVSANVSVAQYEAWSPEERFQYLDSAKKSNALWLQWRFKELDAAWLMVIDGKVIAHGPTIQRLPQEREFDVLCERYGKYPFAFFNPRLFLIEEFSAWHHTVEPDDDYPTLPIKLEGARGAIELTADFDTGAIDAYFDYDLLVENGLLAQNSRDFEDESAHLGQSFRFIAKPLRVSMVDSTGNVKEIGFFVFCVKNWRSSPFVAINSSRQALVGRSLLFKTAPVVHLDFDARHTELVFKV